MGGAELRTTEPRNRGMRRRERVRRVAVFVAAACIGLGGAAGAAAQETAREVAASHDVVSAFRGGGPNTGVVETAGVDRLGALAWRFGTGGPVRSTPAVAGGAVYVGSSDGHLYALDARSGAVLWRHDVGTAVGGAPLVTGDRVVFTDRANRVHAVDRATGAALWRVETGPDLPLSWGWEGWDYILPSAAPAGRNVLVGSPRAGWPGPGRGASARAHAVGAVGEWREVHLPLDEIEWIEADGDYARVHAGGRSYFASERMKVLADRLEGSSFVRVHRSAIVNARRVREVRHRSHGDYEGALSDGTVVRVSRTRRDALFSELEARGAPDSRS